MDAEQAAKIINASPGVGWRILTVAVPTRALRIIVDDLGLKFRIEQLEPKPPGVYKWRVVSTHAGDESFESYVPALQDMINKQAKLKELIKLEQHNARMARIRAENPLG